MNPISILRDVGLFATLFLSASNAHAFFDPPWITPAAPISGATVSVNLRDGICDAIVEHPGYPQITRQGNAVHLVEYGHHWDTVDLCVYDIGHLVEPIGAFALGDYTVTVDFVYDDYPFGLTTINLGVVPFSVAGAAPFVPVPALTPLWKLLLLTLVLIVACWALAVRRRAFV
jgi:hypothetical protein